MELFKYQREFNLKEIKFAFATFATFSTYNQHLAQGSFRGIKKTWRRKNAYSANTHQPSPHHHLSVE